MAVTLNLIVIPVVASLLAGTGAVATYVGVSSSEPTAMAATGPADAVVLAPAPSAAAASKPCDAQTWPYIDTKCLSRAKARPVRVVTAPRQDDATRATSEAATAASAPDQPTNRSGLTSRDTVLHQPDASAPTKDARARGKRADGRAQRGARTYQVPSEARRGSGAVIVVRPLRLDQFR